MHRASSSGVQRESASVARMLLASGPPEVVMRNLVLSPPTFMFAVGTRAALGFGLGLLLSSRMAEERRRKIGLALLAIGAVTTIPVVKFVWGGRRRAAAMAPSSSSGVDERLIGAVRYPRKGDDF